MSELSALHQDDAKRHTYFMPMVDMLAGVVFILVIMLAAMSLVSREDFNKAEPMQQEIQRIQSELAKARALDQSLLTPRRAAQRAITDLLTRLQEKTSAAGFVTEIKSAEGLLFLKDANLFAADQPSLTNRGQQAAGILSEALAGELACLAERSASNKPCMLGAIRLDGVTIGAAGRADGSQQAERTFAFLTAMGKIAPGLLTMRTENGFRLLDYGLPDSLQPKPGEGGLSLRFDSQLPQISLP